MGIEVHQRKNSLRQRLMVVIRRLAEQQRHPRHRQMLCDLSCNLDLTGPIDQSRLPVQPDGFVVRQTTVQRHRGIGYATLCMFQAVSMAVVYYWQYAALEDIQDARSCEHYLDWLEAYAGAPDTYGVIQGVHLELYLYPLKDTPEDKPHPPQWLKENGGETV